MISAKFLHFMAQTVCEGKISIYHHDCNIIMPPLFITMPLNCHWSVSVLQSKFIIEMFLQEKYSLSHLISLVVPSGYY